MIKVGLDLGSAAIKIVFTDGKDILWAKAIPTVPKPAGVCDRLISEGIEALSISKGDISGIASTGYGKKLYADSVKTVNEISANAMGAHILSSGKARSIINIGGQDVKVIKVSFEGRVEDFKMNDKCAAGTGRFFEVTGRILDTPVGEFGKLAGQSILPVTLNSTCAVFAESEIISLLAMDKNKEDIIAGLHNSLAGRISELIGSMYLEDDIYLDGGPGSNRGLLEALEDTMMRDINVFEKSQYTVAFGAANMLKFG
ncbi:MAG: acyl-CoA dehydratase activase [Desulfobacteraceae bacterium]